MRQEVDDQIAFRRRPRRDRKHPQHLIAQPWWRGRLCRLGEHSGQPSRWQLTPVAGPAGIAVPDVAAHPLAQHHGRLPVPADQHPGKIRAVRAPPARHQQRPEDRPQPDTSARDHRMGTPRRHPEHVSEVKAG